MRRLEAVGLATAPMNHFVAASARHAGSGLQFAIGDCMATELRGETLQWQCSSECERDFADGLPANEDRCAACFKQRGSLIYKRYGG